MAFHGLVRMNGLPLDIKQKVNQWRALPYRLDSHLVIQCMQILQTCMMGVMGLLLFEQCYQPFTYTTILLCCAVHRTVPAILTATLMHPGRWFMGYSYSHPLELYMNRYLIYIPWSVTIICLLTFTILFILFGDDLLWTPIPENQVSFRTSNRVIGLICALTYIPMLSSWITPISQWCTQHAVMLINGWSVLYITLFVIYTVFTVDIKPLCTVSGHVFHQVKQEIIEPTCIICHEDYQEEDHIYLRTCLHHSHTTCSQKWYEESNDVRCLVCRENTREWQIETTS
jgi:hypothetical protein